MDAALTGTVAATAHPPEIRVKIITPGRSSTSLLVILATTILHCIVAVSPVAAAASSATVAVVPSFLGSGGAGFLNPADYPAFAFNEVSPATVSTAADLAGYDTVVLWQFCTVASHPTFVEALVDWVRAGGKLLIWDSDTCSGSAAADYSWLASLGAEFTVATAGGNGIRDGSLTIVQENRLSSAVAASPYFIDTAALVSAADAAGDANVMTGWSSVWCADMEGQNARCDAAPGTTGRVHAYTEPEKLTGSTNGWIVYCGLDYTGAGSGEASLGREALVRLLQFELQHGWGPRGPDVADLCGTPLPALTLTPATATNTLGQSHTVTALFTQDGLPAAGVTVEFAVVAGPHAGTTGSALSNALGIAEFTYVGSTPGLDQLQASVLQPVTSALITSNVVTKEWIATVPALSLTPPSAVNTVGLPHTVTAVFTQDGVPAAGVTVDFAVLSGPNAGATGSDVTDGAGAADFTYTSIAAGIDQLRATAHQPLTNALVTSNEVTKTWYAPTPSLALMPATATNTLGQSHTVTAFFSQDGVPVVGSLVDFTVVSGPHSGLAGSNLTDGNGRAQFAYIGNTVGIDHIQAQAHQPVTGLLVTSSEVTKTWVASAAALVLTPQTATNVVGESHTVQATFSQGGIPTADVQVHFAIVSGPHTGTSGSDATDANGHAEFTYTGTGVGTDHIVATLTQPGTTTLVTSNEVTKTWLGSAYMMIGVNDVDQSVGVDQLVRFDDLATGTGSSVGFFGDNFRRDEAIAVEPTTQQVYAVDDARLLLVDMLTGNGTEIGPIGYPDIDGIAFHPQTNILYGVTYGSNKLLRINRATGAGTIVASSFLVGYRLEDIAFHPDGRCFVLCGSSIFQVNEMTGAKIKRWNLTGSFQSMEALAWSPDGTILYSAADRSLTEKDLVTITFGATTADAQFIHSTAHSGFRDIEGLAFVPWPSVRNVAWPERHPTDTSPAYSAWQLLQNYPNPFNPSTTVQVVAEREGPAALRVYDASGRRVTTLFQGTLTVGMHRFTWDGRDATGFRVVSGVYFCQLHAAGAERSIPMVLTK